jgi:diguanylate cyclase (GGDEF)-like protein
MRLRTKGHVWLFALATVVFAGVAVLVEYLVLAPLFGALGASIIIAPLAAGPISVFVGGKFRELTLLYEERERLIRYDRLTQVLSREGFFAEAAARSGGGVTFVLDLDHFKSINDTYGHPIGDKVLRTAARILRGQVREDDLVCRFGGEEFLILASGVSPEEALSMGERIRKRVADTPVLVDGASVTVTVSIGVTDLASAQDLDEAIRIADAALYAAKRGGRNRVVADWGGGSGGDPPDDLTEQARKAG